VDQRSQNKGINSVSMLEWVKAAQPEWLGDYMTRARSHETAYTSLLRLLRKTARSLGFRWRRARPAAKLTPAQLEAEKERFSALFWAEHADLDDSDVFNIDETGVFLDMPPRYTFAEIGGSTQVDGDEKKSARITAVLGVRLDGTHLYLDYRF